MKAPLSSLLAQDSVPAVTAWSLHGRVAPVILVWPAENQS